jgi:hypothetical protein
VLSSGDFGVEGAQTLLPQGAVSTQPHGEVGQRLWAQAVDPPLRFLVYLHESGLAKHAEVTRYARSGDGQ